MKNKINIELMSMNEIQKHLDSEVATQYLAAPSKKYSLDKQEFIREKVCLLPEGELAVVYLKFWEELSEYEISKMLSVSIIAVEKLLKSALMRLRIIYEEDFGGNCQIEN